MREARPGVPRWEAHAKQSAHGAERVASPPVRRGLSLLPQRTIAVHILDVDTVIADAIVLES